MARKSVSSTTKNKKNPAWFIDFQKNWKKSAFAGSLVLLMVLSVGYGGWSYFASNNQSQAATLRYVSTTLPVTRFYGCKSSVSTGYGPIWTVKYYLKSLSTQTRSRDIKIDARRDTIVIKGITYPAATLHRMTHTVPGRAGTTTQRTIYLSQILQDYVRAFDVTTGKTHKINPGQIPNC